MDCTGALAPVEHTFSVDDTIEAGDTFDDPSSDFSVTFTQVDYVTDHFEVTFEASHPIAEVILGLDGTAAFQRAYFYEDGEVPDLTFDAVLPPLPGEVTQATFCFTDAEAIGAQVDPAPPVTGTIPDASNPTGEPIPAPHARTDRHGPRRRDAAEDRQRRRARGAGRGRAGGGGRRAAAGPAPASLACLSGVP